MNILAINTAFSESYVSVLSNNKKVYRQMDSSLKQSENILGIIDNVLNDVNIKVKDISSIACVVGPGSFTGIRIGASIAKGFASAFNHINRICINSLDLLAYTYSKQAKGDFSVVLNALSGNLFVCNYNASGERLCEPFLANDKNLNNLCDIAVGLLEENLETCNNFVSFTSEELLEYAIMQAAKQNFSVDFAPVYLRKSQAEAELEKKENNGN